MKFVRTALCAALFASAAACGAGTTAQDDKASASASKAAAAKKADEAKKEAQQAAARRTAILTARFTNCANLSKALDTKLNDVNSQLSVGMPFPEYSKAVGQTRVAYDRMFKTLGTPTEGQRACLTRVLVPLEGAMNSYATAYNVWNDCINDDVCTMEGDTLKKAQGSWTRATRQIDRADTALAAMNPAG